MKPAVSTKLWVSSCRKLARADILWIASFFYAITMLARIVADSWLPLFITDNFSRSTALQATFFLELSGLCRIYCFVASFFFSRLNCCICDHQFLFNGTDFCLGFFQNWKNEGFVNHTYPLRFGVFSTIPQCSGSDVLLAFASASGLIGTLVSGFVCELLVPYYGVDRSRYYVSAVSIVGMFCSLAAVFSSVRLLRFFRFILLFQFNIFC